MDLVRFPTMSNTQKDLERLLWTGEIRATTHKARKKMISPDALWLHEAFLWYSSSSED
jgi:hypothetical protein